MKRGFVLALVVALCGALSSQAATASPNLRIPSVAQTVLQAQQPAQAPFAEPSASTDKIATLQKQVKALQKQIRELQNAIGLLAVMNICLDAMTADALTGTWGVVDQVAQAAQQRTYFGAQPVVDDRIGDTSACGALQIARSRTVPPTLSPFSALAALFR